MLALLLALAAAPAPSFEVALTLDDLPLLGGVGPGDSRPAAIDRIARALAERLVPATGFVVCKRGDGELVRQWERAGVTIGNHTASHRIVDDLGREAFVADARACKEQLEKTLGHTVRPFRYPQLRVGSGAALRDRTAADVRALGHTLAPVSIDDADWVLVRPYERALARGDADARVAIGRAFVEHLLDATEHYRALSRQRFGREVKQVLLVHAHALAADAMGSMLDALAATGARFVTLEEALADPVYDLRDDYDGPIGVSWLYRVAPATRDAWAWDHGRQVALEQRFGE